MTVNTITVTGIQIMEIMEVALIQEVGVLIEVFSEVGCNQKIITNVRYHNPRNCIK